MKKTTIKALYLFLCSILGMVLFGILHRAVFVLYDLLLVVDYDTYSFGMAPGAISALDFTSMLIMLFLGGWYGIVLGLEWYSLVYGPNVDKSAGLFHGFLPHNWRTRKSYSKSKSTRAEVFAAPTALASAPAATSTTVKVPVTESHAWSFDDLLTSKPAKKKLAPRKTVAKKTAPRKPVKRVKAATAIE